MKKTLFSLIFLLALLCYLILNLGRWLDVTEPPVRSDIVVCLGGGTIDRVKQSVSLIKEGYARKLLLLGESWYNQPYIRRHYPHLPLTIDESPHSTAEEILLLKHYMKTHRYHSALIVTDPPHTRRAKILTGLYPLHGDRQCSFHFIGSGVGWWHTETYYLNTRARLFAWHESIKDLCLFILSLFHHQPVIKETI